MKHSLDFLYISVAIKIKNFELSLKYVAKIYEKVVAICDVYQKYFENMSNDVSLYFYEIFLKVA